MNFECAHCGTKTAMTVDEAITRPIHTTAQCIEALKQRVTREVEMSKKLWNRLNDIRDLPKSEAMIELVRLDLDAYCKFRGWTR